MKNKIKKNHIIKLSILLLAGIISIAVLIHSPGKEAAGFTFAENEVFCLGDNEGGKGKCITIGEYLIYAASIVQESTKAYGAEVWTNTVQDDQGKDISFEEYMKQEIINQIRTTHILNLKAEEYRQSLTEEELRGISTDAQSYYDSLSAYDIGKAGIDLPLILNIYKENALAEKIYNAIITDVIIENGMTGDEYKAAQIHYFDSVYQKLKKESCGSWSYDAYVNKKALSELSFASMYKAGGDNPD